MESFNKKLFLLQQEIDAISKDSKNGFFGSKNLNINSLIYNLKQILKKYHLLLLQPLSNNEVHSIIQDVDSDKRVVSSIELPDIKDPQKLGSCITYFRRYTLQSLLGLMADDDDGNLSSDKSDKKVEQPKEDTRTWLSETQFQATLGGTKEQALTVMQQFRMKKIYKDKIKSKFKL